MSRIKIIGGPCDGEWAEVQGELKDGREITVVRPNPIAAIWQGDYFRRDVVLSDRDWETHQYILRSIVSLNPLGLKGGIETTWFACRGDAAIYEIVRRLVHGYVGKTRHG